MIFQNDTFVCLTDVYKNIVRVECKHRNPTFLPYLDIIDEVFTVISSEGIKVTLLSLGGVTLTVMYYELKKLDENNQ